MGYHVWADLFHGHDTDDLAEATATAAKLAGWGFHVVVFDENNNPDNVPGASKYRRIAEYWPDGRVTVEHCHRGLEPPSSEARRPPRLPREVCDGWAGYAKSWERGGSRPSRQA